MRTIRWKRSREGYAESSDGKWSIVPLFMGTGRPQGYELYRAGAGKDYRGRPHPARVASGDTQGQCKREAERLSGQKS